MIMSTKKNLSRILCLAMMLMLAFPGAAHAQVGDTVSVAYIDYNNFITQTEDGTYTGYAADYLARIAQYTGWEYEFMDMDWPTAFAAVKEGEIDFYCVARQTEERQADFDFSLFPVCNEEMNLYALPQCELYYEDFPAFDGLRIGMLTSSGEIGYFDEYAKDNGFTYTLREYPRNEMAEAALYNGEVDAIALVNHSVADELKLVGNFGVSPAYMMSGDDSERMAAFSKAQEQLYFDDPDFIQELEKTYYGDAHYASNLLLTRDEAEYIERTGALQIALSRDMAPIEYYDETAGVFRGVTVDLLQKITELTGLTFQFVLRGDAPALRAQMERGEIEMVGAMARDANVSRALQLDQSVAFSESTFSLVTKDIAGLTPESSVAIPAGYPMFVDTAQRNGYTNIREYASMEDCVKAVADGEVDLTYIISICEGYLLDHARYADLRCMILQNTNCGICLGAFRAEKGQLLLSIVNKCISVIPSHEINEMIIRNTADAIPRQTLADRIAKNRVPLLTIAALLIAVAVLSAIRGEKVKRQDQLEEKRRQHNAFLQHLYDTLPCGVFRYAYEPPHALLSYNAASAKIYGYEDEMPVIGQTVEGVVQNGTAEAFREKFKLCEETGEPIHYSWPITKKDGSTAYVECVMDLVETEIGKVFQEVFIDETERVLREKQIEAQYTRELGRTGKRAEGLLFTACVNITKQKLVQSDLDVAGIYEGMPVSAFLDVLAPGLREMQSESWLDDFYYRLSCEHAQTEYDNGRFEDSFHVRRRKDGRMQWLRVDLAFRQHPAGDLLCFAYIWDVTDEQVTRDIMQRLAFTDCECFICVDMETGYCLQYAVEGDRLIRSEAQYGQTDILCDMTRRMKPADAEALRSSTTLPAVAERLETGTHDQVFVTLTGDDGERQDKALTYFYTDKENSMLAVAVADVTEVRRDEVRHAHLLSDALAAAERADEAKSQFLSRVSHEMRTPLNAILGFMELAKGANEKTMAAYLESSNTAAKQLLHVINDVLDMSSIESGKLKIAHTPFNFRHLIAAVTNVYGIQCKQKGVVFETRITTPIEDYLVGDELRLNQILTNLLGNAIKFTAEGYVRLTISRTEVNEDTVFIRFVISDTGFGMNAEMLERLFTPFEQESAATASKYGGSGLGLSIVKSLVGLMDGMIRVESKPDEGTAFTVDLPFTRSELISDTRLQGKVDHLRVLVVDDEESARAYMRIVLERMGVRHVCVGSGSEALRAMEESQREGDLFNVCLIDWRMPAPDGFETTGLIREKYGEGVVVIVVSAYDFQQAGDAAKAAGADLLLSKPVFQSALFDLFMTLTGGKLAKSAEEVVAWDFSGRRVLLAEDNELNQIVAMGYLEKGNFAVDLAGDGQAAVDAFLASAPGYYSAILMDVQMPVLDGFTATKAIRESAHPQAQTIPIIAQTANAFNEDIAKALSAGMNAHVAKPIDPQVLYRTLKTQIGHGEAGTGLPHAAPADSRMDRDELLAAGVEYDKGVERFGGKPHQYEKYLLQFLESDPLPALRTHLEADDREEAFRITHDLKGTSGNLNMDQLFQKICELTEFLRSGGQGEAAIRLCEEATALFDAAKKAVAHK